METSTWLVLTLIPFSLVMVFFLLPRITGWRRLAESFPEREGDTYEVAPAGGWNLKLNGIRYQNCMRIRANDLGLSIRIVPPFHWFHGALFLPWSEISFEEQRDTLLGQTTHFGVWAGGKRHRLVVPGGVREPFLSKMRGKELVEPEKAV